MAHRDRGLPLPLCRGHHGELPRGVARAAPWRAVLLHHGQPRCPRRLLADAARPPADDVRRDRLRAPALRVRDPRQGGGSSCATPGSWTSRPLDDCWRRSGSRTRRRRDWARRSPSGSNAWTTGVRHEADDAVQRPSICTAHEASPRLSGDGNVGRDLVGLRDALGRARSGPRRLRRLPGQPRRGARGRRADARRSSTSTRSGPPGPSSGVSRARGGTSGRNVVRPGPPTSGRPFAGRTGSAAALVTRRCTSHRIWSRRSERAGTSSAPTPSPTCT